MSLQTTSYVLSRRFGNQTRKLLMIAIADYTGDDTGTAWAYIDTLAERAECSRRSVQEHLEHLERAGELEIYRNAGPKGSHRFRINFKKSTQNPTPRGANPAPLPAPQRGAASAPGVQMSDAQTTKRGANERRPVAPKTILTEEDGKRERAAPAHLEFSPAEFCDLLQAINTLRPEWAAAPGYSAKERRAFLDNLAALTAVSAEHWPIMRRYLAARLPEGTAGFQPISRELYLAASNDVLARALQWHRKNQPAPPPKPKPRLEPEGETATPEDIAQILRTKI